MASFVRLLANSALSGALSACLLPSQAPNLPIRHAFLLTYCAPAHTLVAFQRASILHFGRPKLDQLHDLFIALRSRPLIVLSVLAPLRTCCGDPFGRQVCPPRWFCYNDPTGCSKAER